MLFIYSKSIVCYLTRFSNFNACYVCCCCLWKFVMNHVAIWLIYASNYSVPSTAAIDAFIAVSLFNADYREPCALGSCCYWILFVFIV